MRALNETYLRMFRVVSSTMEQNKPKWIQSQVIVNCVDKLDANIEILSKAFDLIQDKPTGYTKDKKILRKEIDSSTFLVKEGLRLYYRFNDMIEEMEIFVYPQSKLTRMTDSDLYLEATRVVERAEWLSTQLIPIGISLAKTAKLKSDLVKFYKLPTDREFLSKQISIAIKLIPVKTKETRLMLRDVLDPLIAMFEGEADKIFAAKYKLSRKLVAKPGRHKYYSVLIKGTIKDEYTEKPLSDVEIEAGGKKKKVISGIDGFYKVRIYNKDADKLIFTKEGYETLIIDLSSKQEHHELVVNVEMIKIS